MVVNRVEDDNICGGNRTFSADTGCDVGGGNISFEHRFVRNRREYNQQQQILYIVDKMSRRLSHILGDYRFVCLIIVSFFAANVLLICHVMDVQLLVPNVRHYDKSEHIKLDNRLEQSSSSLLPSFDCEVTNTVALKAIERAKTDECRQKIRETACAVKAGTFTPISLPNSCPRNDHENAGRYMGCYADSRSKRILNGHKYVFKENNSPHLCQFSCFRIGFQLSGVQYENECFCGDESNMDNASMISEELCAKYKCPGDNRQHCGGFEAIAVYRTGVGDKSVTSVSYVSPNASRDIRIVFLLQFNGRDSRQVKRLLKMIYSPHHFYYIHVDRRQLFMYNEMHNLQRLLAPMSNVVVADNDNRYSTIWAGASLLQMMLSSIRYINKSIWHNSWDYLLNLSESDMPILTLAEIESVLNKFKGHNFLRSHGYDSIRFIQKQGLEHVFVECENHMWRIGERGPFPDGVRLDGGSDWIALDRKFAYYAANSNETLPRQLRNIYESVLLPVESFFHTLAVNSHFCDKVVNSNLKITNWKRKQGCRCIYKSIVDWCGCSPNNILPVDFAKISEDYARKKGFWLARKFESIISQQSIAQVEKQSLSDRIHLLPNTSHASFNAVWLNDYRSSIDNDSSMKVQWAESIYRRWRKTVTDWCNNCRFVRIESIHVYKENDSAAIELLVCIQLDNNDTPVMIEIRVRRILYGKINEDPTVDGYILDAIDVGAAFDPKEEIFRNYAVLLSANSRPTVRLEWSRVDSTDPHINTNFTSPQVIVDWLTPDDQLAISSTVAPWDSPHGVQYIEMPSKPLLVSGVWHASVLTGNRTRQIAQIAFVVFSFENQQSDSTIDLLSEQFYRIVDYCSTNTADGHGRCIETVWSSFYPDPKSTIAIGYDYDTKSLI